MVIFLPLFSVFSFLKFTCQTHWNFCIFPSTSLLFKKKIPDLCPSLIFCCCCSTLGEHLSLLSSVPSMIFSFHDHILISSSSFLVSQYFYFMASYSFFLYGCKYLFNNGYEVFSTFRSPVSPWFW